MARSMLVMLIALSSVAVCLAQDTTITYQGVVSDTYNGTQLTWTSGLVQGPDAAGTGTATRGFGVAAPAGYTPDADQVYPLVLYLHGAGARGSSISSALKRQTPRYFAKQAQITPEYAAFVVVLQVPSSDKFVDMPWNSGPYEQNESTYTDSMCLTENLIYFLCDPSNNTTLAEALGLDADDIDKNRIYVVGDSMGAFGVWDIVARQPYLFAASITSSGNGPKNKLEEIKQTPLWAIHGKGDSTVPNKLPSANDTDGDGSLAMLVLLDPGFDNTSSTDIVRLDNYASSEDDPNVADTLVYSEFPSNFGHATVAMEWTARVSGTAAWLFSHSLPVLPTVGPIDSMVADANGIILSINGLSTDELVLGVTTFQDPPTNTSDDYLADKADDFDLNNGASGDNQPYYETMFDVPVSTIFLIENNGNDSGYFQGLDIDGNSVGPMAPFTAHEDYLKFDEYRFFLNQQASGIMFVLPYPVYGLRIIKPDDGPLGFDALSISGIPALPKVMPMTSMEADETGMILAINGIDVNDLILGVTVFPDPPKHPDPNYHADKADNFDLSNGASGDDQFYFETLFGEPVTTIFLVENNGNDSGYFQALDQNGDETGPMVPFTAHVDYLKTDYQFFLNQRASGIVFEPLYPVYGLRIIKPDDGLFGFDALSISAVSVHQ